MYLHYTMQLSFNLFDNEVVFAYMLVNAGFHKDQEDLGARFVSSFCGC